MVNFRASFVLLEPALTRRDRWLSIGRTLTVPATVAGEASGVDYLPKMLVVGWEVVADPVPDDVAAAVFGVTERRRSSTTTCAPPDLGSCPVAPSCSTGASPARARPSLSEAAISVPDVPPGAASTIRHRNASACELSSAPELTARATLAPHRGERPGCAITASNPHRGRARRSTPN